MPRDTNTETLGALPPELRQVVTEELRGHAAVRAAADRAGSAAHGNLPDLRAPYFGHLRLRSRGRLRDVYLGWSTFIATDPATRERVTILDWRSAPLAGLFFAYRQGDPYEEELDDGRVLEGEVVARRLVTFAEGELIAIDAPEGSARLESGRWLPARAREVPRLGSLESGSLRGRSFSGEESLPRAPSSKDSSRDLSEHRDPDRSEPRSAAELPLSAGTEPSGPEGTSSEGGPAPQGVATTPAGHEKENDVKSLWWRGSGGGHFLQKGVSPARSLPPTPTTFTEEMLDSVQREAVERQGAPVMLVLGDAGCGKTLVALFRMARWAREHPEVRVARDLAVVVPEPGLSRLIERILERIGLREVRVRAFDDWVVEQARRLLAGLPQRLCADTPPAVERFKRHPALREVIPEFVRHRGRGVARRIDRRLGAKGEVVEAYEQIDTGCPSERLDRTEELIRSRPGLLAGEIKSAFAEGRRQLRQIRHLLVDLVSDRLWLDRAVERSQGTLTSEMAQEVILHQRRQTDLTTEERFADVVDQSRLATLDGRPIDWGTPDEVAGTLDVADHALLLELLRALTGRLATPRGELETSRFLVVDEAQDLAPIELGLLGQAVAPSKAGEMVVAGDRAQHIDPAACFSSWEATLGELGGGAAERVLLTTTYRCPRPVAELGRAVLGELAPRHPLTAPREDLPLLFLGFPTAGHQAVALIEALADLRQRQPEATIALIARRETAAVQLYDALERGIAVRLVTDGGFAFKPGIEVTDVSQVKGLEFDYVILPDVSAVSYPDRPLERRTLHVAVTRARRQLWVSWVGKPSALA